MPTRRIRLFFVKCAYSDLGDIFFHNFRGFFDSTIEKDGTQLLNNENGSDEKCSQCACFWLKIIKGILFGVWDLLQNSFDSGLIYRWRKISFKKKQFDLFYLVFNSYASALIKRHPLSKWEMISVDSFSLVLLKEKVDRRVTLATCGICYDICL